MSDANSIQTHGTGKATGFIPATGVVAVCQLLSRQLQDTLTNCRRNPELCVPFQCVEQRAQLRNEARGLGLEQDAEHADGFEAQLHRDLMTTAFIHQQSIGMDFEREGQRGGFAGIETGGTKGSRDGGRLLLSNPRRQRQPLEARSLTGEAIKFGGDFQRDDNFVKKAGKQFDLSDAAEVEQHRRVGHDDHERNRALSEARSSSSICSVQMGMPRSPRACWKLKKSTPASSVAPTRPIRPREYKAQANSNLISSGVSRKFSTVSGSVSVTAERLIEAAGSGQTRAQTFLPTFVIQCKSSYWSSVPGPVFAATAFKF